MLTTTALTRLTDSGLRQSRAWVPQQLYRGHVAVVNEDGSVEVVVNQRVYTVQAQHPVQAGDLLSLRLLGTQPHPHFAVVGLLCREDLQRQVANQQRAGWPEAVALLRQQDPGIATLLGLWQRYPQQLAQLSSQLPVLLGALQARSIAREELLAPGRLKAHGCSSWGLGRQQTTADSDTPLIPLLARLLGQLQPARELRLEAGLPVLGERADTPVQSLQPMVALYRNEQESGSAAPLLRQLLTINVEQALLSLVGTQLQTLSRNGPELSIWIMQLMLQHGAGVLPVDLLCQQQLRSGEQRWQLDFSLELPHSGQIDVTLLVKFPAVALRLCSMRSALVEAWRGQQDALARSFKANGLKLEEFICVASPHAEREAAT